MEKPQEKIAIVIDEDLPAGQAVNLATHLGVQLGTKVQRLGGGDVVDASGIRHGGLPVCPNVILAASPDELARLVSVGRKMAGRGEVLLLEYPEEGFTTATDEEFRAAVARLQCAELKIRAILIHGLRRQVNAVTRGLPLWK